VNGTIIEQGRGEEGFGYDPIFLPDGSDKTFAEMSMVEKNDLSHRGRAIAALKQFLHQ
jgi:XTP/dITP diphosphohydrolase